MTLVVVLLSLIAVLVCALALAVAAQWWRRRQDQAPLRTFGSAMRVAHDAMGVHDSYSVPRILATGEAAALDALCRGWRLTPACEPAWFGRIWHDAEGIVIAEPNDMLAAAPADRRTGSWRRLLRALLRNRPGRPLDAILWVIAAETLIDEKGQARDTGALAVESSRKLVALQHQFGLMLPLYIVVSGCDLVAGFDTFAAELQRRTAGQVPVGWASPYPPKRLYEEGWIQEAIVSMRTALAQTITEMATLDGSVDPAVYLLPQRLEVLHVPLRDRIDLALRGAADGTAPILRGIHCIGAMPHRAPSTGVEQDKIEPDSGQTGRRSASAFSERLWRDVLLAGQGLASPIPRVLALRMRRHRVATVVAALAAACWCVGIGVSWWHLRTDTRRLSAAYDTLTLARTTYRESDKGDAATAQLLGTVANTLMTVPRWRLTSPLMPLSYLALERELRDGQRHLMRSLLFKPLRERLLARLGDLVCTAGTSSAAAAPGDTSVRPQDMPEYLMVTRLVDNAAQTERLISGYNELVQEGGGNVTTLAQVLREVSGTTLLPDRIPDRAALNDVVYETSIQDGAISFSSRNVLDAKQRASTCFEDSFEVWLDRVYSDSALTTNAAAIQATLANLREPGAMPTDATLAELATRIDTLTTQIDTADHGWASARGKELVPGMSALIDSAQRSRLIGDAPVQAVLTHEQVEQRDFAARWLANANLPGVLSAAPASGLQLAPDLQPLRTALRSLLAQPFVTASGDVEAAIRTVDASSIQQALAVLPTYRQYVGGQLAQAPDTYRSALLATAGNDTVLSMVRALSAPASPVLQRDGGSAADAAVQFDALRKSAVDLIAAFDSLGRDDLATSVALRVSDAALNVLRTTEAQLQAIAPFRPIRGDFADWDGRPGGALRAFGTATPQALQSYLAAQSAAIADVAGSAAGALDWLATQRQPLDPADARLVGRWKALGADLTQYRAKSPTSAMVAVPALIADQLDKLDVENCSASLAQVDVPPAGDIVASAGVHLISSAREQCFRLQMGGGTAAYERIRSYFSRYLAGRFPFAADADAPAADLRQTVAFAALLDKELPAAQRGLAAATTVGRGHSGGEQFIAQLARAKPWLDALVARGADGALQGMEVNVEWRVDRADEVGADQVIEWKLASGSDVLAYPPSGNAPARWKPGLPASLSLRWAKDSMWRPMADTGQPTLTSDGDVATWAAGDTWALLRLMRLHQTRDDGGLADAGPSGRILLSLPVRDRKGDVRTARMFLRIGFVGAAKVPLAMPELPVAAPAYEGPGRSTVAYPDVSGQLEAGRG